MCHPLYNETVCSLLLLPCLPQLSTSKLSSSQSFDPSSEAVAKIYSPGLVILRSPDHLLAYLLLGKFFPCSLVNHDLSFGKSIFFSTRVKSAFLPVISYPSFPAAVFGK